MSAGRILKLTWINLRLQFFINDGVIAKADRWFYKNQAVTIIKEFKYL